MRRPSTGLLARTTDTIPGVVKKCVRDWLYDKFLLQCCFTKLTTPQGSLSGDLALPSTSGTADTSFAYDNAGRVTQMVDGTGTTSWVYDAAGQISSLTQPQGTLTYTYNTAGQRTAQSGAGQSQSWTFNSSNGRLTSQTNDLGETTSFLYDSLGRLQKKTFSPGNYEAYT